jgi:hypothetical protein
MQLPLPVCYIQVVSYERPALSKAYLFPEGDLFVHKVSSFYMQGCSSGSSSTAACIDRFFPWQVIHDKAGS